MDIKPIKTKADYRAMLKEIDSLMGAKYLTPEGERLDVLVTLIEAYEAKHYPIDLPDPVEAIMRLPIALSRPAVAPSANATDEPAHRQAARNYGLSARFIKLVKASAYLQNGDTSKSAPLAKLRIQCLARSSHRQAKLRVGRPCSICGAVRLALCPQENRGESSQPHPPHGKVQRTDECQAV